MRKVTHFSCILLLVAATSSCINKNNLEPGNKYAKPTSVNITQKNTDGGTMRVYAYFDKGRIPVGQVYCNGNLLNLTEPSGTGFMSMSINQNSDYSYSGVVDCKAEQKWKIKDLKEPITFSDYSPFPKVLSLPETCVKTNGYTIKLAAADSFLVYGLQKPVFNYGLDIPPVKIIGDSTYFTPAMLAWIPADTSFHVRVEMYKTTSGTRGGISVNTTSIMVKGVNVHFN